MTSKSLPYFQLSISDELSDKESEQSISDILSLSSPLSIWMSSMIPSFSFTALSSVTVSQCCWAWGSVSSLVDPGSVSHLWALAGDSTGAQWSHFSYSGDLRLFSVNSSSFPGLHLSSLWVPPHCLLCRQGANPGCHF